MATLLVAGNQGHSAPAHLPDDDSVETLITAPAALLAPFIFPTQSAPHPYIQIDPTNMVPAKLKAAAVAFYQANQSLITNKNYLSVVDFSSSSDRARFFIIDMNSGAVLALHVAHGKNSDPTNQGLATLFSNIVGSEQSSLGFYLTAETYSSGHGLSLKLEGLSPTNSKVRERIIVLHGVDYVVESDIFPGRSWGCLAIAMRERDRVVEMLKGGSVIYAGLN